MSRRAAFAGLAAFCAVPSLANNAPSLHETAARQAKQLANGAPLNLRLLAPSGTGRSVDDIIDAFHRMTGIAIHKVESPLKDIGTDLTLDHLSQSGEFDIAMPATFALNDLAHSGAIVPVSDYAAQFEPEGFRDGMLYTSGDTVDGSTYGFQSDGDAYLMFYNKAMLENPTAQYDYGLENGTPLLWPRTWAELDRQIAFFHRPDDGQYGGLLFRTAGYVAWEWWVRFHAKGMWPFTDEMEPLIACEKGVEALEDMKAVTPYLHPSVHHNDLVANWRAYAEGTTFANIGWGGSQKYFQRANSRVRNTLSFGPTPGGVIDGQLLFTPYFNWGWTYVVTASCPAPEIAYLFNLFAASPAMSTHAIQQTDGFFDPFRAEHYDDPIIQATYSRDFLKVHRHSLENAIPDLYLPRQAEYFQTLNKWIYRAISGQVPAKMALNSVAQRWDTITRAAGKSDQIKVWKALKRAYPARARALLREVA